MERRGIHPKDMSDEEEESTKEVELQGKFNQVRLFKVVITVSCKPQSKVLTYDGSLNAEDLIN